jgi:hypothetical protein
MQISTLGVGLALVILLVWLVRSERRPIDSRALMLLRCLFPAWRFFEEIAQAPELSYRVGVSEDVWGPWRPAIVAAARSHWSLLANAQGNLRLACQTLVEQFVSDLESAPNEPEKLVSYALVQALVEWRIGLAESLARGLGGHYQFRVSAMTESEAESFVSVVHALQGAAELPCISP